MFLGLWLRHVTLETETEAQQFALETLSRLYHWKRNISRTLFGADAEANVFINNFVKNKVVTKTGMSL